MTRTRISYCNNKSTFEDTVVTYMIRLTAIICCIYPYILLVSEKNLTLTFSLQYDEFSTMFITIYSAVAVLGIFGGLLFVLEFVLGFFVWLNYSLKGQKRKLRKVASSIFFFVGAIGIGGFFVYESMNTNPGGPFVTIFGFFALIAIMSYFNSFLNPDS